jgi:hypothetical protein
MGVLLQGFYKLSPNRAVRSRDILPANHFVARISSWAKSALRIDIYLRRTYSGRPSFRDVAANHDEGHPL